jgi:hypothetical protein
MNEQQKYDHAERVIDNFFGPYWEDALTMGWKDAMHQVNDWQVSEWDDELIEDHYFKVAFERYIKMINEWQDEKNG